MSRVALIGENSIGYIPKRYTILVLDQLERDVPKVLVLDEPIVEVDPK